jgi:hypothetical protein
MGFIDDYRSTPFDVCCHKKTAVPRLGGERRCECLFRRTFSYLPWDLQQALPSFEQQADFALASQLEHSFFEAQDARKKEAKAMRTVERRIISEDG